MTIPAIDTHEFTRRGDAAHGVEPLAALARLGSMLTSTEGELAWRLTGRSELGPDGSRSAFLRLALDGTVRMRCVRCLEAVALPLHVTRDYLLVATEEQAEREDADEEEVDLLVASRRFDLAGLVEDEAIMALPAAPRHEGCSAPVHGATSAAAGGDVAPRSDPAAPAGRHPFAALAALRDGAPRPAGAGASTDPGGGADAASGGVEPGPAGPARPGGARPARRG